MRDDEYPDEYTEMPLPVDWSKPWVWDFPERNRWSWPRRLAALIGVLGMTTALVVVIPAIDDLEPGLSLGQIAACFLYGIGATTMLAAMAWDDRHSMPSEPLAQMRWWLGR